MIDALTAAAAWGGTNLRLISNRENAVYEMHLHNGARAALRLHRQGYQSAATIRSELWWCGELARAGVSVPDPLPDSQGEFLFTLPNGRLVTAIKWVEGTPLGQAGCALSGTPAQQVSRHFALGRLIARIHDVTDTLTLPPDFTRARWDIAGLVGETPFWGRFWEHSCLTVDEKHILNRARDFLTASLKDHIKKGASFGPIHADVLRENVLVNDDSLSLIDFDDSGIGFRLYDLGTVLSQNLYQPNYTDIRNALIEGYRTLRPECTQTVEVFVLARTLASVGWTASRLAQDDPINRSHIDRALMWAQKMMA